MYANADLSGDEEEGIGDKPRKFRVDSDSFLIVIVNHASTRMTKNVNNFIGPIRNINNRVVKGYLAVIKVRGEGTHTWIIEEGDGEVYSIIIHNVN